MPLPSQTFATLDDAIVYINTHIIPNGVNDITGEEHNNVENALAYFIKFYTLNSDLHRVAISSSTGVVVANAPITYFMSTPSQLSWPDNVQNEFYFVNATGSNIPLATGFVYYDEYQDPISIIPARSIIHIAKAVNTNWVKVAMLGGSGSGSGLPPQTNHSGGVLITNGTSVSWGSLFMKLTSADFELDGRTINAATSALLAAFKYDIFINEVNRYIYNYEDDPPSDLGVEWTYEANGGFNINATWFNAGDLNYHLYLYLRELNS